MRDLNKNKFRENIIEITEEIIPTLKDIEEEKDESVIANLKDYLLSNLLEKTIACYSIGDDKEKIKQSLLETINVFEKGFKFDFGYGDMDTMVWIISLAILCEIDSENFKKITSILIRDNVQDELLDFLIQSKDHEWKTSSKSFIQEHPYQSIKTLIVENNAEIIIEKAKVYLDKKWYQGHNQSYWYNSHRDALNLYFGYWSWEVAAIVKIKGIDDSSLQNQKYYPYDAVHW